MIVNNPNFRRKLKRGVGSLGDIFSSPINPTTIWTPSTGFLATPGVVGANDTNSGTVNYQSPTLLGAPPCSKDPNPWVANSAECIAQLLANQQHDMGANNLANYNVDLYNCLNTYPQPTNCYERTFGLTPVGGYTGGVNTLVGNAQAFLTQGVAPIPPTNSVTNMNNPTQTPTVQTQQLINAGSNAGGSGQQLIQGAESFLGGSVGILGHDIPVLALGIAAIGAVYLVGSRH